MTDNQGAWTLGCYGNRDIRTPHITTLPRTLQEAGYTCGLNGKRHLGDSLPAQQVFD